MLFKLISKIYSYKSREFFISISRAFRSRWLQPQFKSCRCTTRFEKIGKLVGAVRISIGESCYFAAGFYITSWDKGSKSEIVIGNNCFLGGDNLCHAGTLLEQRVLGTRVQSYRQQHGRQQGQYVFMSCSHNSNDMQFRLIERGNGYLFRIPVLYFKF